MLNSIKTQTNSNYNIIVSCDDDDTERYVKASGVRYIRIHNRIERQYPQHNPYNDYCNLLLDEVSAGWIMFADDDDCLADNNVVDDILRESVDVDAMYIYRMQFPSSVVPSDLNFGKRIRYGDIGGPNLIFNAKYKNATRWPSIRGGDYVFITKLYMQCQHMISVKWIDRITYIVSTSGNGTRNDIDIPDVL